MKILFLSNNPVAGPLADWLSSANEVTIHEDRLNPEMIDHIRPDIAVSYSYRHLVRKPVLDLLPERFINLHVSLLPFNRGADPNFWSLVEHTPTGVSIHLMSEGLDEGDILAQRPVHIDAAMHSLSSSYDLLHSEIQDLFRQNWPAIASGTIRPVPQMSGGTMHYAREFAAIRDKMLGPEGWDVPVTLLRERYARMMGKKNGIENASFQR